MQELVVIKHDYASVKLRVYGLNKLQLNVTVSNPWMMLFEISLYTGGIQGQSDANTINIGVTEESQDTHSIIKQFAQRQKIFSLTVGNQIMSFFLACEILINDLILFRAGFYSLKYIDLSQPIRRLRKHQCLNNQYSIASTMNALIYSSKIPSPLQLELLIHKLSTLTFKFTQMLKYISHLLNFRLYQVVDSVLDNISQFQLFNQQAYFYNLKVQVGTQTVNSGSILTNQLTSVLNQVSIISRLGSTISVNSAAQLNVIQQRSTSTSVRNLLINLLFLSTSTGNITLIGTVEDIINIKNYQILGKYYSTNQLCLGALESNNSQIFLQMVNMQPANFVVGNQSAYLLVFINRSQVQVSKVSLILDNGVRTSIATTNVRVLQFGGIIQNMNCSAVSIKAVSQRDTSQFITNYVSNSGLLIGSTTLDSVNELSLSQICSYVQLSFKTTTWINSFGLVGQYCGKLSILSVQLQASIGSSQLQCFGVIGMILSATYQVVIQNIIITITMVSKGAYDINEENISSLIGSVTAFDIQISDANINCSTVAAYSNCALLIGYQFQTQVSVLNTNVNSSNAKSNSSVGGLIAVCIDSVVQINAVIMQSINTSASGSVALAGILIGSLDQSRQVIADLLINSSSAQSITSTSQAMSGGFCAQSLSSDNLIINSQILGTNSSAQGITAYAGSIVGQHTRVDKLTMQNCLISLTQVNAAATTIHAGIISGQCSSQTTLILLYSFSNSNTLNRATTTSCQLGSAQSDGC
ncbi:Hypothetical_protein [Hexamita inflata]|uniref:Hypothetical_protein n=1 Tax=Hexamita inflata TaxID=28002 RepID=A0AA86RMH7_9EUKA|nr:Hypothetical protein HINF_LOCUS62227 [Hexamita inflata]